MFRRKITWNLTLLVALFLIIFAGIVIAAQFFVVGRSYTTSDYTTERENQLKIAASGWEEVCWGMLSKNNSELIQKNLNRYAEENNSVCFMLTEDGKLLYESANADKFSEGYVNYILNYLGSSDIEYNNEPVFRVKSYMGLPTRYIGISRVLLSCTQDSGMVSDGKRVIFSAVTKEVYTSENYMLLKRYSILLFAIVAIVSILIAKILAQYITKPVLQIRDIAVNMSNMDFSKKCDYHSNNEIGDLASSLNFLSEKLDDAIRQLESANRKLQNDFDAQLEIDRMRKTFIASASHEFKTPLTIIRGYLEMMHDNRLSDKQIENAEIILMKEVDRMDLLVLSLLEISSIESETDDTVFKSFDLSELLSLMSEKYRPIFSRKNLIFELNTEKNIRVYGDENKIEEVISNFLLNAIKYTPEEKRVSINVNEYNGRVKITVFNEGSHIPEKHIQHLWEPFYRADKARARKTGGNGLGLTICRNILIKHESNYGVENVSDGVEFFFDLKQSG